MAMSPTDPPLPRAPGAKAPPMEPVPGYHLLRPLGKGGFGEVWEAKGPGGFHVAFKFVALTGKTGELELRALEIIKNLKHPNLITIFGTWQVPGWLIIGMELADQTLQDKLNEARKRGLAGLPQRALVRYSLEAAKVIDYLNKPRHYFGGPRPVGIQHGDIKPQNILLLGEGIKVGDFGLLRLLEKEMSQHVGGMTLYYAAPELLRGNISQWTDQYALAVTWCQLRGGQLPFTGSPAEIRRGHLDRPPDLSMLPEVERPVVARALAKNPQERWPTCRAFIKALVDSYRGVAPAAPSAPAIQAEAETVPPSSQPPPAQPSTTPGSPVPPSEGPTLPTPPGITLRGAQRTSEGAHGSTWRAETTTGQAVKVLQLQGMTADARTSLTQSLDRLSRVRHPHLTPLLFHWHHNDTIFTVFPWTDLTMRDQLKARALTAVPGLPANELAPQLRQLGQALDHLHACGFTHGAVQPENLALAMNQIRLSLEPLTRPVEEGMGVRWSPYIAPEVWQGMPHANSDQYGLAMTCVELRSGQLPFTGESLAERMFQQVTGRLDLTMFTPAERAVLERALSPRGEERFPSCAQFVQAWEQAFLARTERRPKGQPPAAAVPPAAGVAPQEIPPAPELDAETIASTGEFPPSLGMAGQMPAPTIAPQRSVPGVPLPPGARPGGPALSLPDLVAGWGDSFSLPEGPLSVPPGTPLPKGWFGLGLPRGFPHWLLLGAGAALLGILVALLIVALNWLFVLSPHEGTGTSGGGSVWWILLVILLLLATATTVFSVRKGYVRQLLLRWRRPPVQIEERLPLAPSLPYAEEVPFAPGQALPPAMAPPPLVIPPLLATEAQAPVPMTVLPTMAPVPVERPPSMPTTIPELVGGVRVSPLPAVEPLSSEMVSLPTGDQRLRLEGHREAVWAVAVSPDGKRLASASMDGSIRLWDSTTGDVHLSIEAHALGVTSIAFAPDGRTVVSGGLDQSVRLWDSSTGKPKRRLQHPGRVFTVAFGPLGQHIVSAGDDRIIRLWELATGEEVMTYEGHEGWVNGVTVTPDGRRLLSCSEDGTVRLWDILSGELIRCYRGHEGAVKSIALFKGGRLFASAGEDHVIRAWGADGPNELWRLEKHTDWVRAVAFAPTSLVLLSGGDDERLLIWDWPQRTVRRELQGHLGSILCLAIAPDGSFAVTGSDDQTLCLWPLG